MFLRARVSRSRLLPLTLLMLASSCEKCGASGGDAADSSSSSAPRDAGSDAIAARIGDLPAGEPFEGTIVAEAVDISANGDHDEEPPTATYKFTVKGQSVRWDLFGEKSQAIAYRIYDGFRHQFITVLPATKTMMIAFEGAIDVTLDAGPPRVWEFSTISTEGKVADYPCERLRTTDALYRYDMCVATGLPPFPIHILAGVVGAILPFNGALQKKGLFPLSTQVYPLGTSLDGGKAADAGRPKTSAAAPPIGRFIVIHMERFKVNPQLFLLPDYVPVQVHSLRLGTKNKR